MNIEELKGKLNSIRFLHHLYDFIRIPRFFLYDFLRFRKHYMFASRNANSQLACIIVEYHAIERALSLPEMRHGFGQSKLLWLMNEIDNYVARYENRPEELKYACGVIQEYRELHHGLGYVFPAQFQQRLDSFCKNHRSPISKQLSCTKEEYWSQLGASFDVFSKSRHSVRSYAGKANPEHIKAAVNLANHAPSACNRQYVRVHCINNKALIEKAFALQRGNRGFGHIVETLIILTADIRYANQYERNDMFTNIGIYCMNLAYSLHFHKIANCILNWSAPPSRDKQLHKLLGIPEHEEIGIMLACGELPETVKLAASPRNSHERNLTFHN